MIGYKVAKNGETRVVITLDIPKDALTNQDRRSIVNKDTAKYRTNKVIIRSIKDETDKQYDTANSFCYDKKSLTYIVGQTYTITDYDSESEKVCSTGIHYFLNRRVAELYDLDKIENGLYEAWHENGQKRIECMYMNSKLEGLCKVWYENGQKRVECTYVNSKLEGLCQVWYENGQKRIECTYMNGRKEGLYREWHENGKKSLEYTYVNGKC